MSTTYSTTKRSEIDYYASIAGLGLSDLTLLQAAVADRIAEVRGGVYSSRDGTADGPQAISSLEELCRAHRIPSPEYRFVCVGLKWAATIQILGRPMGSNLDKPVASKKAAKGVVARMAFRTMEEQIAAGKADEEAMAGGSSMESDGDDSFDGA